MLEKAEKAGLVNKDTVIIEPTSGNTGIGLAFACAIKGYKMILTMPETMSIERRLLLKGYGAKLVLTEGCKGMHGAVDKAEELHKEIKNSFIPQQFNNPDNPESHYLTTANEIWKDMNGKVDIFIAGVGTGGTFSGTTRRLKELNTKLKAIAVEPASSQVLAGKPAGAHKLQGIGANFIPKNFDNNLADEIFPIEDEQALITARNLAHKEGILAGISGGAAMFAALELAKRSENNGKNIVVVLPDNGERYLSSELFSN